MDELECGRADPALLINANANRGRPAAPWWRCGQATNNAGPSRCTAATERGDCLVICYQGELDAIEIRNLERNAVALSIAKLWNEKRETEKTIASSTLLRHLALVSPPDAPTLSAIRDRLAARRPAGHAGP